MSGKKALKKAQPRWKWQDPRGPAWKRSAPTDVKHPEADLPAPEPKQGPDGAWRQDDPDGAGYG